MLDQDQLNLEFLKNNNMNKTLKTIDKLSHTIFWSMLCVLVFLVGVYGYMVNKTVWNAFNKDKAEAQIVALNSKLGDLEFEYMTLSNNISIEKAYSLGFQNASSSSILFATRDVVAKNVAMK